MSLQVKRVSTKFKVLSTLMMAFVLVAQPMYGFVAGQVANATSSTTTSVTPSALGGWTANSTDGAATTFVSDATAPLGSGALEMTTTSSNDSITHFTHSFAMPLSQVSKLSYDTKQLSATDHHNGNITMRVSIDTTGGNLTNDQLMFEPYFNGFNGNTQTGWQTWNVAGGKFWSNYGMTYNGHAGPGSGSYATNFTLADVLHDYPHATLTGLVLSMGTYNVSQDVLADNLVLNDTAYNFDPVTLSPCTTTTTVKTTDLSTWNASDTRTSGHNTILASGLHVYTDDSTSAAKAAAYYPASFKLADLGTGFGLTATGTDPTPPALQLTVDLDGNGTAEGNLVEEPIYGANTLWLSSNWTGIDLSSAPTAFNGGGTGKGGTVDQWLAAFPNAKVMAVGYSLGSGVKGDFVVTNIAAGCTNYTFGLGTPQLIAPTNGAVVNGASVTNSWSSVPDAAKYEYQSFNSSNTAATPRFDSMFTATSKSAINVADGTTFYWRVRAIDANGNPGSWSDLWHVTIDSIAPAAPKNLAVRVTSSNAYIPNGGSTNQYAVTASWANGSSEQVTYIYKYWKDGSATYTEANPYQSPTSGTTMPGVYNQGEGINHFCVVAVDMAGNESACSATYTVTYDTTAPTAAIAVTSGSQPVANNSTAADPIIVTGSSDTTLKSHWFEIKAPNGKLYYWTSNSNLTSSVSFNPTAAISPTDGAIPTVNGKLVDGSYTVRYVATDLAGNRSDHFGTPQFSSTTFNFSVDNTAPSAPVITSAKASGASGAAEPYSLVTVYVGGTLVGTVNADQNGDWSLPFTPAYTNVKTYDVTATATDGVGNVSPVTSKNFTISGGQGGTNAALTADTPTPPAPRTPAVPTGTPTVLAFATPTATPDQAVLGASDQKSTDGSDQAVKGASDTKSANKGCFKLFGLCWYWTVAIIVVVVAIIWWFIAAMKRRDQAL